MAPSGNLYLCHYNRVDSRFCINETSQISEHYSVQMKAVMKQTRLVMFGQMYISMIEYQNMIGTQHLARKGCARAVLRPELLSWTYSIQNHFQEFGKFSKLHRKLTFFWKIRFLGRYLRLFLSIIKKWTTSFSKLSKQISGINIFLDGFIPTENLRFREESLVFKVSENASEEEIKRMSRYDYPHMKKTMGNFQ